MSKQKTNNWSAVRLGELFHFHRESIRPGSQPDRIFQLYSLPAVDETGGAIPTKGEEINSTKYLLRKPTILVSKLNPRIPRVSMFNPEADSHPSCSSTEFMTYSPVRDEINLRFYFHFFNSPQFQRQLERTATGTTNSHSRVTPSETLEWTIPHPSVEEQRRIADVLDTVDAAIRETDAVIAKQEQVKTGLLQDLLTRGLDAEGRLRDPETNPEAFRETEEYGLVPNAWRVTPLISVVPQADYGISASLGYGRETPVLRMNNLKDGEIVLDDLKGSDSKKARELLLEPMAVLFNRTNSAEHVGRTAIWRGQQEPMSFASYLVRLVPDPESLDSEYLNLWLNWSRTQQRIRQFATPGVSQVNINPTNLRKTLIALPKSLEEQERIVQRIDQQRKNTDSEKGYRTKLQRVKTGLMQDLLTGRVRVAEAEERINDMVV